MEHVRKYTGLNPHSPFLQDTWEFAFTPELFEQYKRDFGINDEDQAMPAGDSLEQAGSGELGEPEDGENVVTAPFHKKQVCVCVRACVCACMCLCSCHACRFSSFHLGTI